jgi:hypothetical protein
MTSLIAYLLPDPEHSVAARSLLVVGYVVAGACWWRASRRPGSAQTKVFSKWWLLGATLLLLLAANKLLNLRGCFEAGIRALAKSGDWYDQRVPVQFFFAVVLPALLAALTGFFLAAKGRRFLRSHHLALTGWILLLLYLVLRQAQEWKPALSWLNAIHYHDWRLALEVAGILIVALAALIAERSEPGS